MRRLYMKQKIFSLRGRFTVQDEEERDAYFIEGSFMKIPKSFSIKNDQQQEVALITKKILTFLPRFYVDIHGQETIMIEKHFSFFKARYSIHAHGIEVKGNWWDMDFEVYQNGELAGAVSKKWISVADRYQIEVVMPELESLLVAIVVAIDCVKADQAAAAAASV